MFDDIRCDDERQEAWALFLEGNTEAQARKGARSANDKNNSYRISGPITGGDGNGHRFRPMISDMTDEGWADLGSITQDARSDAEREFQWSSQDDAATKVQRLKRYLSPRQWEFFANKFGLDGLTPAASHQELADRLGLKKSTVGAMQRDIMKRIGHKLPEFSAL